MLHTKDSTDTDFLISEGYATLRAAKCHRCISIRWPSMKNVNLKNLIPGGKWIHYISAQTNKFLLKNSRSDCLTNKACNFRSVHALTSSMQTISVACKNDCLDIGLNSSNLNQKFHQCPNHLAATPSAAAPLKDLDSCTFYATACLQHEFCYTNNILKTQQILTVATNTLPQLSFSIRH